MGNFLSGATARLIYTGGASRAACLFYSDFWHVNGRLLFEGGQA